MLLLLCALVAAPVYADASCEDPLGCVELAEDDPIVLGAMLSISGVTAFFGDDARGGIELAILDRGGELLGREIEVIVEDSLCAAEGGQTAARRLISDSAVVGIIGTNCSIAAQGALPLISDAGLLMISPSNAAPSMTNADIAGGGVHRPGYFRTFPNDVFQASLAAQFAYEILGAATAATIHDGTDYGESNVGIMGDKFSELGGEIVYRGAIHQGDVDMSAVLTEVAAAQPDLLYFPMFQPESEFVAAQTGSMPELAGTALFTSDSSLAASFAQNTGSAAIGMYLTGPFVEGEAYQDFLAKWDEEFGGSPPSGFHTQAYDATNILLDAVAAVAHSDGDGGLLIGRGALRDAIHAVEDYPGLSGALTCLDKTPFVGDCASNEALAIFQITAEVVAGERWPPPVIWHLNMDETKE